MVNIRGGSAQAVFHMKGRKPIPTEIHKLNSTYKPSKQGDARQLEPIPVGDLMYEPPNWLSDSQQDGWRFAVSAAPPDVLKRIDQGILAAWVIAEDDHRTACMVQTRLDSKRSLPMLTKDARGQPMISLYQKIKRDSALLMIKTPAHD